MYQGITINRVFVALVLMALLVVLPTAVWARYHHGPWPDDVPSPQYVNIAPLPGAGVALDPLGDPDGTGALQINIPVAYTPRWGYIQASAYKGEHPNDPGMETDNGTGVFALGFFGFPSVYMSAMQTSGVLSESKAVNLQMGFLRETETRPALAVGVQDLLGKEANGQSIYLVATKRFQAGSRTLYGTFGYGGGRFLDLPIAGVSMPLGESFNVAAEWDGYQINTGFGWRPGGRKGWFTFLGGYNWQTGFLFGGAAAFKL